jgi:hypothetical protein
MLPVLKPVLLLLLSYLTLRSEIYYGCERYYHRPHTSPTSVHQYNHGFRQMTLPIYQRYCPFHMEWLTQADTNLLLPAGSHRYPKHSTYCFFILHQISKSWIFIISFINVITIGIFLQIPHVIFFTSTIIYTTDHI